MVMSVLVVAQLLSLFISNGKCLQLNEEGKTETLSVVVDSKTHRQTDIIQIIEPPKSVQDSQRLKISYHCSDNKVFGIEIITNTESQAKKRLFHRAWRCKKTKDINRVLTVKAHFPKRYAFKPDIFQKYYEFLSDTKIRVWILDEWQWQTAKRHHDAFMRAFVKASYLVEYPPPFSRPRRNFEDVCVPWNTQLLFDMFLKLIPKCSHEEDSVEIIKFPAVMTGLPYGIVRTFQPYKDPELENGRRLMLQSPSFTLSVWLYVLEYCRDGLCGIITRIDKMSRYLTPLIFLTKDGSFHIQITQPHGQDIAAITNFNVPLHQWFRFVFTLDNQMWTITFHHGSGFNKTFETSFRIPGSVYMNDTEGLMVVGGMEGMSAFRGYVGQATYYRNQIKQPTQIPFPGPQHPMFELQLSRREDKCLSFLQWTKKRLRVYKLRRLRDEYKRSSFQYFATIRQRTLNQISRNDSCLYLDAPAPKSYRILDQVLRRFRLASDISDSSLKLIGSRLFKVLKKKIDADVYRTGRLLPVLKQSACLGDNDAMFLVAVILNNGFLVKADEMQALAYLMMAALDNHRLSFLAIGNKHKNGLDTLPLDLEQAYMYFKYVADTTREDREKHKETDVLTESIRLTDDANLREQTDEDGDVFHWWIHQAKKGVFTAQQHVARMMFWGTQGLKRNVQAAVEYYKMGVESKDPSAMYDYGVLLMRGQGMKKNVSEGLSHIRKSAEQKNPEALNALGWYAMNFGRNFTQAAAYFEDAYRHGNPDAAFHLGILHLHGNYPNKTADPDLALQYFSYAATRNQFDAGISLAYLHHKGTPRSSRNIEMAVEWVRFIAEKNPHLGLVLRSGLHSYRHGDHFLAMLYYMMAAEAGIEVGTFNLAWLCEENKDGTSSFIEKDCQWRNYNLSTRREHHFVDSYAFLKMGDYYWYGCGGQRDADKAAEFYTLAASKGDPQGIFNLAYIFEEGAKIFPHIWQKLRIPKYQQSSKFEILHHLYSRCRDSPKTEAYIPCTVSLYRIFLRKSWQEHETMIKITSFAVVLFLTIGSIYFLVFYLKNHVNEHANYADVL
ncbi:protein sel-1 homolog 3-like [Saccostrea echinata]|uniref:protein sel-1 homolog 3-like n=1 Tax=Saccostrea echinata TaxID=191078 RepID=UPI002A816ADC|nr:protein sel-1 homolog 3-like [Saccostrea echinata]